MKHRRLQELDRSDFEIVDKEPDIRGWDVKNTDREKIGEVEELIVDAQEKKVRYMVVDLKENELNLDRKKVLIPIGLAELDKKDDDVIIPNISPQQFGGLPLYDRDQLTADVERRIFSTFDNRTQSTTVRQTTKKPERTTVKNRSESDKVDPEFYKHEYYNLDNLYKNRMHEAEPANKKNESEYERGLRLWERRSEGTVIPDERGRETNAQRERDSYREMDEEARMEMIKNRRNNYQQRRYTDSNHLQERREGDIERTKDDKLQNG